MAMAENPLKAAFLKRFNLAGLGGLAILSLATMSPVPLLVAAGLELVYLGTVPALPSFRRSLRLGAEKERRALEQAGLDQQLEELSPNQRECYFALKDLRDKTLENYRRLPGGSALLESSSARLDGLLVSFVRLLGTLNDYRRYLNNTDRRTLEKELAELRVELGGGEGGGDDLRELKKRRVEILEKRVERFDRAAQSREIISHQLASIEDFLRLLHEQSITIRDPTVVDRQLDRLAVEVQATDDTVRETERFMAFSEEISSVRPPEGQRVRG